MKEVKEIFKRIAELEQSDTKEIDAIEAKISACRAAMQKAAAVLEVTDEPDEYKAAQEAIKENKTAIELYNRKLDKLKRRIDPAEAAEACEVLSRAFDAEQERTAGACYEQLCTLLDMLAELERKHTEYATAAAIMQSYAGIIGCRQTQISCINLSSIIKYSSKYDDTHDEWMYFINDYYSKKKHRDALEFMYHIK